MANFLFLAGSRSEDFESDTNVTNPLPPCSDSPNCVLITKKFHLPKNVVSKAAKSVLENMDPIELKIFDDPFRMCAVFKIFIFKDDFIMLIEKRNDSSTRIHIRSSSRIGHSDLGINRRRVNQFLKKLDKEL